MSRQDKATTEKHARTLRELVKKPENKVCADCKRNDPRWASWNIGVFLCIRCSGIHRGMGTHISKVKSVDLDVWTPEQMESIQKWGNRRANIYWEAHLKAGHMPPEHKMESFIRSKYESRRWAKDGPPPMDPSTLEQDTSTDDRRDVHHSQQTPVSAPSHTPTNSVTIRPPVQPVAHQPLTTHQLLSTNFTGLDKTSRTPLKNVTAEAQVTVPSGDLFSLDFHAPTSGASVQNSTNSDQPKKDVKQDILSLFSAPNPVPTSNSVFNSVAGQSTPSWSSNVTETRPQFTSMVGTNGVGAWGASSGWTGTALPNAWANPGTVPAQSNLFNTSDIWNTSNSSQDQRSHDVSNTTMASTTQQVTRKDDVFGDLWGR